MIQEYSVAIVCSAAGAAEVYLGDCIRGTVQAIKYTAGTLDAGTDIVVTGETTKVAILTDSPAASEWFYPRAKSNGVADGVADATSTELIWLYKERAKVVVAQGGDSTAGSITIYVDEEV